MKHQLGVTLMSMVLLLTGCDSPETLESGTVTDRDRTSASVRPPALESWRLRIEDGERSAWIDVTEEVFDRCEVGEQYPECATVLGRLHGQED